MNPHTMCLWDPLSHVRPILHMEDLSSLIKDSHIITGMRVQPNRDPEPAGSWLSLSSGQKVAPLSFYSGAGLRLVTRQLELSAWAQNPRTSKS